MNQENPFKYFKTSPEIIRLAVMYYVRYPLSYRQVGEIVEQNTPHEFFDNPQVDRTQKFLEQILDH